MIHKQIKIQILILFMLVMLEFNFRLIQMKIFKLFVLLEILWIIVGHKRT